MRANWEWRDGKATWIPFEHKDNTTIEAAYQKGDGLTFTTTDLSFNLNGAVPYTFDFKKLTQTNGTTGRVRKLRRIESGEDDEEMEFVTVIKRTKTEVDFADDAPKVTPATVPAAPLPPAPSPIPTAATKRPGDGEPSSFEPLAKKLRHEDDCSPSLASPGRPISPSATCHAHAPHPVAPAVIAAQVALGSQSKRNQRISLGTVVSDSHAKYCFEQMLRREEQLAGEWAAFYHSYSFAALLYEVQAAVAAVLFRYKSEYGALPRLLKKPYADLPDADALLALFPKMKGRDHDPRFRAVAICATSSLLADDSEAPPKRVFLHGYSLADTNFVGVLENLLLACGVPSRMKSSLSRDIIDLSTKHGLDTSQFKGKPCASRRPGHLLQIFVHRSIVNKYVYGSFPFGVLDTKRKDLGSYLEGRGPIAGQVRIVTNPSVFMRGNAVRMYVFSADPKFHAARPEYQRELTAMLGPVIGSPSVRIKAAEGIYNGGVPSWFRADDFEIRESKKVKAATATTTTATATATAT